MSYPWYTIEFNCNGYFSIVLRNAAVVFPASLGRITNHSIYGLMESDGQAGEYNLNLAQIKAELLGSLLAAKRSPRCLTLS